MDFDNTNGVNRVERNNHGRYFMPRVNLKGCNVLIDGQSFYDQPVSDQTKKYNELRKVTIGKGDDYTTGCLLDYDYFLKHYNVAAIDLSKQKKLDAVPRVNVQIELISNLNVNSQICSILEKSKMTTLKLYKGTAQVL